MEVFLDYLKTFAVGGLVCMIGQFLINKTRMSSARILVTYMLVGVVLEICGAFEPIKEFAGSGITIPIIGFGSNLAKGALEGVKKDGFLGAITGGMSAVSAGLTTVIVCGFVFGLISRSRSKKM
ncbi:MAG: SpoVA/SpoVAEb family sporulation membrane protein [Christensenella sp.]|nr:MAG: SpoVA/SpoVAEb family sporulation membrane protein [Christensenella sp.]